MLAHFASGFFLSLLCFTGFHYYDFYYYYYYYWYYYFTLVFFYWLTLNVFSAHGLCCLNLACLSLRWGGSSSWIVDTAGHKVVLAT